MDQLISGKNVLVFLRPYKNRDEEDGTRIRFQSEVTLSEETEVEGTATTDGIFNTVSDGESTIEFNSLAYISDKETTEGWHQLKRYRRNQEYMEAWIVYNVGRYQRAEYATGYLNSFELSADAEGQVELSYSFTIDGNPIEGVESLTQEQLQLVNGDQEYRSVVGEDTDNSDNDEDDDQPTIPGNNDETDTPTIPGQ